MRLHRTLALILALCLTLPAFADGLEDDVRRLDGAITASESYTAGHNLKIQTISDMLNADGVTPEQRFGLYGQLFEVNYAYQYNAALDALEKQEEVARSMGSRERLYDVLLSKATLQSTSGLFLESRQIISSQVDTTKLTPKQMLRYYNYMQRFCSDYREYSESSGTEQAPLIGKTRWYREQLMAHTGENDPLHMQMRAQNLIDEHRFDEANIVCRRWLGTLQRGSHDYAIATYYQALISEALGDEEGSIHWYIESAIADTQSAVKDNASLCCVALKLFGRGDVERAFRYMQFSLSDALFYNAKLRPWQIAQSMPAIEKAYSDTRQKHATRIRKWMAVSMLLAAAMLGILLVVLRMYRRQRKSHRQIVEMNSRIQEYTDSLREANEKLTSAISDLSEANAAKEEYLGLFLSMCSTYIGKLKKYLTRDQVQEELDNFYKTFDNAFLQLYPDFVEEFNGLLKPEERIVLKKDELLNTELRIFALIKLGITQSSHIASLLRYSVNTIYNYRAQIKNAALEEREDFEEKVRNIGNPR